MTDPHPIELTIDYLNVTKIIFALRFRCLTLPEKRTGTCKYVCVFDIKRHYDPWFWKRVFDDHDLIDTDLSHI